MVKNRNVHGIGSYEVNMNSLNTFIKEQKKQLKL